MKQSSIHKFFKKSKVTAASGNADRKESRQGLESAQDAAAGNVKEVEISDCSNQLPHADLPTTDLQMVETIVESVTETIAVTEKLNQSQESTIAVEQVYRSEPVKAPADISSNKDDSPSQPKLKLFPRTNIGGRMRSFNSSWYEKYEMLEYSKQNNRVYCFCCRHFSTAKPTFFVTGYSDWKNMSKQFEIHFTRVTHQRLVEYNLSKMNGSIVTKVNSQHHAQVLRNREILATHSQIILLCAQQDIALRGHRETYKDEAENSSKESENHGNFLAILDLLKKTNPELSRKASVMPQNAKYTSKDIQNEIISICGNLTRRMITEELHHGSKYYAIIADESRDSSGVEQLSVCLRYVNGGHVRERFIGFCDLHKFDADTISRTIIEYLTANGFSLQDCVGQAYDGASVMAGDINGVHARMQKAVGGTCFYVHCYAHRLNLVLMDSCNSISVVRDILGLLQAIYNFQKNSIKRKIIK